MINHDPLGSRGETKISVELARHSAALHATGQGFGGCASPRRYREPRLRTARMVSSITNGPKKSPDCDAESVSINSEAANNKCSPNKKDEFTGPSMTIDIASTDLPLSTSQIWTCGPTGRRTRCRPMRSEPGAVESLGERGGFWSLTRALDIRQVNQDPTRSLVRGGIFLSPDALARSSSRATSRSTRTRPSTTVPLHRGPSLLSAAMAAARPGGPRDRTGLWTNPAAGHRTV